MFRLSLLLFTTLVHTCACVYVVCMCHVVLRVTVNLRVHIMYMSACAHVCLLFMSVYFSSFVCLRACVCACVV